MFPVFVLLLFLAVSVSAHLRHTIVSTLARRQTGVGTNDCNVTCAEFAALETQCTVPHCGCNIPYLQAQGNCLLCKTNTSEAAANVQTVLDDEIAQCHTEGLVINFQLQLPPAAAAILREFYSKSEQLRRYQVSFLVLQIAGGHVGLVLVLFAAFFSRKVHRRATFVNFCITWIFSSIVFSLSLYRGTQQNTLVRPLGDVSPVMCLAQGALTNGAQAMTACSTLAVVMELWLNLRVALQFPSDVTRGPKQSKWTTTVLLVAPYILFLTFTLSWALVDRRQIFSDGTSFSGVMPTNFYCMVVQGKARNSFVRAVYAVTLGLLLLTVFFDAFIIHILCREWYALRQLQLKRPVKISTLLRVIAFSIFRMVVAVAYGALFFKPPTLRAAATPAVGFSRALRAEFGVPIWIDVLQASMPLVAFLIFGMNKDMVSALSFWRNIETEKTQRDLCKVPAE